MQFPKFVFLAVAAAILLISIASVEAGKGKQLKKCKKQLDACEEKKSEPCIYNCDPEFVHFGSSCYLFSHDTKNWQEAQQICKTKYDAHLAELETVDENNFVIRQAVAFNDDFWLGGNDLDKENDWIWASSGQPLALNTWSPGNPSNSNSNEDCLEVHLDKWNDDNCSKLQKYVCEKQAAKSD